MQLFGVQAVINDKIEDRLLRRAASRIVDALALTEFDTEDTARAMTAVFTTDDPVERLVEFRELRDIINTAGNKWASDGAATLANSSVECPNFIKDAVTKIAKAKNVEVFAVDPEHAGEAISHITDLQARLKVLGVARDELDSTVALRVGILTWQQYITGTTVP